jgi:hypothetical protein
MVYIIEHSLTDERQSSHRILYATTDKEKALDFYNSKNVVYNPNPLQIESYTLSERNGIYFNVLEFKTNYAKSKI